MKVRPVETEEQSMEKQLPSDEARLELQSIILVESEGGEGKVARVLAEDAQHGSIWSFYPSQEYVTHWTQAANKKEIIKNHPLPNQGKFAHLFSRRRLKELTKVLMEALNESSTSDISVQILLQHEKVRAILG